MKSLIKRSLRKNKFISIWLFVSMLSIILLYACSLPMPVSGSGKASLTPTLVSQAPPFTSNGERIYFTATSDRGTNITYTGGPSFGGMMGNDPSGGMMGNGNGNTSSGRTGGGYNGSSGGMMGNGNDNTSSGRMGGGFLTCASCHGADGRGGVHTMMGIQTMTAKDIRWSALKNEFDAERFRLAVTKGQDPDGTQLKQNMPRWQIGKEDLADLIGYLKTL